jgi:hypothetical protein
MPPMHAFPMESNLDIMGGRQCDTPSWTSSSILADYLAKLISEKAAMLAKS